MSLDKMWSKFQKLVVAGIMWEVVSIVMHVVTGNNFFLHSASAAIGFLFCVVFFVKDE